MNDGGLLFPFAIALGVVAMGVDTAVNVIPTADLDAFFEVHSIKAERTDGGIILHIDRTIHRPIHMAFTVQVMRRMDGRWAEICTAPSNVILYDTERALPDPVTLDWWTWGKCVDAPPGPVKIVTTWDPEPLGLGSLTVSAEVTE